MLKYLKKHTAIFESIKTNEVEKLKRLNKTITIEELKYDQVVRQRYISTFMGYAKKILHIWACPVDILFRNLLISDLTKEDIPYCIVKPKEWDKVEDYPPCPIRWYFDLHTYSEWQTKRNNLHRLDKYWEWRKW